MAFAVLCGLIGLLALIGWLFGIHSLRSPFPSLSRTMMPNMAPAVLLIGVALCFLIKGSFRNRCVAGTLGAFAMLVGLLTLAEYAFAVDFGIDQLLFKVPPGEPDSASPSRITLNASASLFLLGSAIVLSSIRHTATRLVSELLALLTLFLSIMTQVGFVLKGFSVPGLNSYTAIAFNASIAILCGSAGFLLAIEAHAQAVNRRSLLFSSPSVVLFSMAFIPYAIGVFFQFQSVADHHTSVDNVVRDYGVEKALDRLLESLNEFEMGYEMWLLKGDSQCQDTFDTTFTELTGKLAALRSLGEENPEAKAEIDHLDAQISALFGRKDLLHDQLFASLQKDSVNQTHDELKRAITSILELNGKIRDRIDARISTLDVGTQTELNSSVMTSCIAALLFSTSFILFIQENRRRKKAQLHALAAQEHMENVVDTVREPLIVIDEQLKIVSANRSFHQAFKTTPAEISGCALFEICGGSWNVSPLKELLNTPADMPTLFENILLAHDFPAVGRRVLLLNARKICRAGNNTQKILLAIEDITGRQEAEQRAMLLSSILDKTPDIVAMANPDRTITYLNQAGRAFLGMALEQNLFDMCKDGQTCCAAELFRRDSASVAVKDGTWEGEVILRCHDATVVPFSQVLIAHKSSDGRIEQLSTIARDISARKQAEEELRRSREDLNRAQAVAHVGNWRLDVPHNKLLWSDEAHRIFGIPKNTPLAYESFLAVVHPEDRGLVNRSWKAGLNGEPYDIEHRIVVGKQVKWIREQAELEYDSQGVLLGGFGTAMDITEMKNHEAELRRINDRLTQQTCLLLAANKELEAFSYSVSHDLRAPLRHINGFLQLLRAKAAGQLDEKSTHYLDTIDDSSRQMGVLIDDLLAFSRMGRAELCYDAVALTTLVNDILRDLKIETTGRKVEWRIASLPCALCDKAMIKQVFINLIDNALKYTRTRDAVMIEIGASTEPPPPTPSTGAERETRRDIVIYVRDNGVGFDMKYASKLFGVFQRLHPSDQFEGTGIGLANVRRIVNRHGGNTWAESELDKGATFYFTLPAADEAAHMPHQQAYAPPA